MLHGAQADALVLCHEPTRRHMRGLPEYPLPDLKACVEANLAAARLTNPAARFVGVSVNTSAMPAGEAEPLLRHIERELDLPAVDAFKDGTGPILARLD